MDVRAGVSGGLADGSEDRVYLSTGKWLTRTFGDEALTVPTTAFVARENVAFDRVLIHMGVFRRACFPVPNARSPNVIPLANSQ